MSIGLSISATWGGRRAGAGRPARGAHASEPHKVRPHLSPHHPVHVVARWLPAIARVRRRTVWTAIRAAVATSLARGDFRVVVHAIRRQRLELVVEADDRLALARGMQGLQVAAARALNRGARRRGTVFPDRYAARILVSRSAVRSAVGSLPRRCARPSTPLTALLAWVLGDTPRGGRSPP